MLVGVLALAGCGQSDLGTPQEYATALFDGINEEREAAHLAPLEWSDCLADKAQPRAQAAAATPTLEHESLVATCLEGVAAGENLGRSDDTPESIVAQWMESPGHAQNITRPGFTIAGIACAPLPDAAAGYACSLLFEGGE